MTCTVSAALLFVAGEFVLLRYAKHSWYLPGPGLWDLFHDRTVGWIAIEPPERLARNGSRLAYEHEAAKPPDTLRIICLGDSFTYGAGVPIGQEFPAYMAEAASGVDTVNLAHAAFGVDQSVLVYEEHAGLVEADIVLLAVTSYDLNRARWDRYDAFLPKPVFRRGPDGEYALSGVPVPDFSQPARGVVERLERSGLYLLARRAYWRYVVQPDAAAIGKAVMDRLRDVAGRRGQEVALAYLPVQHQLHSLRTRGAEPEFRDLLAGYAEEHDLPFVDLVEPFLEVPPDRYAEYFLADVGGHYGPPGHRLVGETVLRTLGLAQQTNAAKRAPTAPTDPASPAASP